MRSRAGFVVVLAVLLTVGLAAPASAQAPPATLRPGASGSEVAALQQRLVDAGYWLGTVDGSYGYLTTQAVLAFQKVHGLDRDGIAGPATLGVLASDAGGPAPRSASGVEIDKTRQVLMLVRDGRAEWTFNTSTGNGQGYRNAEGDRRVASTPSGSFKVSRQIDGLRISDLGELWRPKYFNGGIAVHGSTSVPAFAASHGCVRVSNAAMNWIWDANQVPIGTPVLVY
jgi:lipoprotein-anchoring transpeptidase ErfK/SrfK